VKLKPYNNYLLFIYTIIFNLYLKNNEFQKANDYIKISIQLDPKYITIINENLDLDQELSLGFIINNEINNNDND
jgi:hypothetical protein